MSATLEQNEADQLDIFDRLMADEWLIDVAGLLESKGVTDADISQALSVLNPRSGKNGVVFIVLMPTLKPDAPNAPGPRYVPRITVQVIDQPLLNLDANTGVGKTAAQVAERIRTIIHRFRSRCGAEFGFAGQDPIPVEEGKNSYGVAFTRLAVDAPPAKCADVTFAPRSGASPQAVTLDCVTPGARIFYTLDGTYPSSRNEFARPYAAPLNIDDACTIRAAAELTGYQQSNVTQASFT